ncbi:low affinity immunoglobulin gamma Fc region receptor III-A-like isoform X2 [Betta splendens]|uniref:low affinity immunoglobulin gamma Fc region receptor III-A-like isoform X2 n=1 Tax=Betta splendens TaxID=158456 RepID=UPI0010F55270|nr:low affinity immunoglobulin gamma Fc region receptor III-A-like isoform X2 [Betta splendens]
MEAGALSRNLVLNVMILLCEAHTPDAASLRIEPNRAQLFEYEPLTFYCDGVIYCEVVHKLRGTIPSCKTTNKVIPTGSSCTITNVYADDSGEYWCNDGGGGRSNSVIITVTDGSVMLEVPALPVMEGDAVTLRCRNRTASSPLAHFYKDGVFISSSSTGNVTIHRVSSLHEGLYGCSISGAAASAQSRLVVVSRQRGLPSGDALSTGDVHEFNTSSFTSWLVVTVLLAVLLVVMGFIKLVKANRRRAVDRHPSAPTPGSGRTHTGENLQPLDPGHSAQLQTTAFSASVSSEDGASYYLVHLCESPLEAASSAASTGSQSASPEDAFYSVIDF